MSQKDYTAELLGVEDAEVEKVEEKGGALEVTFSLRRRKHTCPCCGAETDIVHDYRSRILRDTGTAGKRVLLRYRRRRYCCPACGKRFSESCAFAGKYQRCTRRVTMEIMEKLHHRRSMKDIARDTGTSVSAVTRCLSLLNVRKPDRLPRVLALDEFKGDANGERFQCILTSPETHRILDILPARTISVLQTYLKAFPNRQEVEYVVMDMNRGFRDIARTFFPQAKIVIDRFHVTRYCTWAMDDVRRRIRKALQPETRRYFKRSRRLLLAHRERLNDNERADVDRMLRFSETLLQAYALKEAFYHFMNAQSSTDASALLKEWFEAFDRLKLPEFKACYRMLRNWKPYILNAFDVHFSNGFTEGCNNAAKTLKRVSFGIPNFNHLRTRILLANQPYPNI